MLNYEVKTIMIPKKIHYCWFGRRSLPKKAQKCIESWEKFCPDYEIIEWNENNFDFGRNLYLQWCYEHQKWAFLSDLVRLLVVYENGGIYFDTDVELIRSPNELLQYDAFYGFENNEYVATGLGFGTVAGHPTVLSMIEQYSGFKEDILGDVEMIGCPVLNTKALLAYGLKLNGEMQKIGGAVILPADYLNPYDDATGRMNKTSNTISIHWYLKSALSKKQILRSKLTRPFHRIFGVDCFKNIRQQ